MKINGNSTSLFTQNNLLQINKLLTSSMEKLSSGFKINSAADDATGLAISEKFRSIISAYEANLENTQSGISMMQQADGQMGSLTDIVSRIDELTQLSANGTLTDTQRGYYQDEVDVMLEEYDRIVNTSNYNTINLLDGSIGQSAQVQGDIGDAAGEASIDGNNAQSGNYQVDVVRAADNARGFIQGESAAPVDADSSLYDFLGSTTDGQINLNVEVNGEQVSVTANVENGGADTISDLVNNLNDAFEEAGIDARADFISADIQGGAAGNQPGIAITSNQAGSANTVNVDFNIDTTASAASTVNSTPNIDLNTVANDGNAVGDTNFYDDLNISLGSFNITDQSGGTTNITVNQGDTLGDIVNNINTLSGGNVEATLNQELGRIEISDTSGFSTGTLRIEEAGGGTTAGDLGILGQAEQGTIEGQALSRTRDFVVDVTGPGNNTARVLGNYTGGTNEITSVDESTAAVVSSGALVDGQATGGGISGVNFSLDNAGANAGDSFEIAVGGNELNFIVGPEGGDTARFAVSIGSLSSSAIGLRDANGEYNISTQASAQSLIDNGNTSTALNNISSLRSQVGAYQNTLTHITDNITTSQLNLIDAEDRISGTDMAKQMMELTRLQVMQQTNVFLMGQENVNQSSVLSLLGGL